jgi:hypothetical protein
MPHGAQPGHNGCLLPAQRGCPCQQTRWSQGKKRWDHLARYSRGWLGLARLDKQSPDNAGGNSLGTDRDPVWASAMAPRVNVGASSGPLWAWNCWWSSPGMRHSQHRLRTAKTDTERGFIRSLHFFPSCREGRCHQEERVQRHEPGSPGRACY